MLLPSRKRQIDTIVDKIKAENDRRYIAGFAAGMESILEGFAEVLLIMSGKELEASELLVLLDQWRAGVLAKTEEFAATAEAKIQEMHPSTEGN